ncbi:hypothetical protein E2C01_037647 [Portunus trituberculatus]|uniref:Uncharacterized protein n=1 Tax=Portunus trituberculatus TaxID=210409 RepID=A0A5B7FG68_PORTR|nr:hypothetical protein [Portunus trituberculatus]
MPRVRPVRYRRVQGNGKRATTGAQSEKESGRSIDVDSDQTTALLKEVQHEQTGEREKRRRGGRSGCKEEGRLIRKNEPIIVQTTGQTGIHGPFMLQRIKRKLAKEQHIRRCSSKRNRTRQIYTTTRHDEAQERATREQAGSVGRVNGCRGDDGHSKRQPSQKGAAHR